MISIIVPVYNAEKFISKTIKSVIIQTYRDWELICVDDGSTDSSFAIINEYGGKNGSIYHFDFCRIKKLEEVYDMGYEDYFYSGALCFIEWPELIEEVLPEDAVKVEITEKEDGTRAIVF